MESVIFSNRIGEDLSAYVKHLGYSHLGVITDSNTIQKCYPLVRHLLPEGHSVFSFEAGEAHKNLEVCTSIWQWMTDEGFDRKAIIINLGGGVVGDMGGFCAATYKRGVRFINVPTTLLSQVDASVGGKLGVDFNGLKNHIGVFALPEAVFVADVFLETLPQGELRSGYAEVIKHGLIMDAGYFRKLKTDNWYAQEWRPIIEKSVSIKRSVVEQDPKESGLRKILNFGHTIGHAFESYYLDSAKHLLHGEAIAVGMVAEAYLSHKKAGLPKGDMEEVFRFLLEVYGKFEFPETDVDALVALCLQDKKNEGKAINFSLLKEIGSCDYNIPATEEEIRGAILFYHGLKG